MKLNTSLPSVASALLFSSAALGAGFRSDVHSARANGMGSAQTAAVNDASGIFFNAAAIQQGKGLNAQLGVTATFPSIRFDSDATQAFTKSEFTIVPPPHLYVTYGITDKLTAGIGIFSPFGTRGNWPDNWEGRFRAVKSSVATYDINPTVAYRIHERFRLGLGFQIMRGTVDIERKLDFVNAEGNVRLGGGAWGYGWNIGGLAEVVKDRFFIGVHYRSQVFMRFNGVSSFSGIPNEFQSSVYDQPITSAIRLPNIGQVGLLFNATEKTRLALDAHWQNWAQFEELKIEFDNPALTNPLNKDWRNTVSMHFGVEHDVKPELRLRGGLVYDMTASPDDTLTPDLPDYTRVKVAAGLGWHRGNYSADFGYQFTALVDRRSTVAGFSGDYSGNAHVLSLTLGTKL